MATSTIKIPQANKVTISGVNYTFGGKTWYFYKIDRIVVIVAPSDLQTASAGSNTITTSLPEEYRPFMQVYFGVQNAQNDNQRRCFLSVSASGTVSFYTPVAVTSAINCGFAGCYVTNS